MNPLLRAAILGVMMLELVGCAYVQTDVTRFPSSSFTNGAGKTFKFSDGSLNLEESHYAELISAQMNRYGWTRVSANHDADYAILFLFGRSDGKAFSYQEPIFGVTNSGISQSYGTVTYGGQSAFYSGTSYSAPTYGQVGSVNRTGVVYLRELKIGFFSMQTGALDFEIRATSAGSSPQISEVMPAMIKAAFKEFPGKSGKTSKVSSFL